MSIDRPLPQPSIHLVLAGIAPVHPGKSVAMADTEFSSFNDRRTSESLGEPAAYQASQGLEEASSEQIFNLTGTAKLSSEHFARLQMDPGTSPSQDQIGAWPPSNSSSSTSVQVQAHELPASAVLWCAQLAVSFQMLLHCLQL